MGKWQLMQTLAPTDQEECIYNEQEGNLIQAPWANSHDLEYDWK